MPPIKTIRRRKWHRPGDRWQFAGEHGIHAASRHPRKTLPVFGCYYNVLAEDVHSMPGFIRARAMSRDQQRLSLRKIAPAGRKG